ncbi:hypothetical protein Tco_1163773 [Tanacetum coccineum]
MFALRYNLSSTSGDSSSNSNAIESLLLSHIPLRIMILLMEEIDLVSCDDGSLPLGIESYDVDSVETDIYFPSRIACLFNTRAFHVDVIVQDCRIVKNSPFCSFTTRSGYHQKDRKPSQNDKTEHGMEKTVQNQGQSPKMPKSESILKNQQSSGSE